MVDSDSEYSEDFEESSREESGLQNLRERRHERKKETPDTASYTETEEEWEEEESDSSTKPNTAGTHCNGRGNELSTRPKVKKFVPTVSSKKGKSKRTWNDPSGSTPKKANPKAKYSKGGLLGTSPRDREMSARNNLIRQKSSRITYLEKQLDEIKKENRLLNRIQVRQGKELDSVHGNGELPKMIHRHNEELRYHKEKLKQMREANDLLAKKLHSSEQSASALYVKNAKLTRLTEEKSLLEREQLTKLLNNTRRSLKDANDYIKSQERNTDLMYKKREAENRFLDRKNKILSDQVEDLKEKNEVLSRKLKEREKESDVLNIYTQKLGRNFPKIQTPEYTSKESQTEVSLSSNKELFSIPPSLSISETQTIAINISSVHTQTEKTQTPSNKSESLPNPSNSSIESGAHNRSPEPSKKTSSKETIKSPVMTETLNTIKYTEEPSTHLHQAGESSAKLSVPSLSGASDGGKSKVGHAVASNGTAQLKTEEELRKKMLLSKLLTMGSGTSEPMKSVLSPPPAATSKKEAVMYEYNSQPAAVPPPTIPISRPRQPGTVLSLSASLASTATPVPGTISKPRMHAGAPNVTTKTAAPESLLQTKPSISNVAHSVLPATSTQPLTSASTAAPFITTQSPTEVTHAPLSTQQFNSQLIPTSSKTSIPRPQAASILTSTTYNNPTGSVANVRENPYAFGSTFNSDAKTVAATSKFPPQVPAQAQLTSLHSPSIIFGSTSQQQSAVENPQEGLAKSTSKITTDKKKELLAKLAAIDSHDNAPHEDRSRMASKANSNQGSTTHLWPNTVQNLHQGKPAYATDGDPYGSRLLIPDSPKELGSQRTAHKFNSPGTDGRHGKIENKPSQSSIDGSALNRKESGLDVKSKKLGGSIFANIVGNSGPFNSNPVGSSGAKVFGTDSSGIKSMRNTGQIRTTNTSSFNSFNFN